MEHVDVSGLRKTVQAEILEEDQGKEKEVKSMATVIDVERLAVKLDEWAKYLREFPKHNAAVLEAHKVNLIKDIEEI